MRLCLRHIAAACLMLPSLLASGQATRTGTIERAHTSGSHSVRVRMDIAPFNPDQHKIRYFRPPTLRIGQPCAEVDGKSRPLGVDCDLPETEIRSVAVWLNGVKLAVPTSLFRDCFNIYRESRMAVLVSDDGTAAFVFVHGSDAAGSYEVIWVLRADGHHSRVACPTGECSGGGLLGLGNWDWKDMAQPEPN